EAGWGRGTHQWSARGIRPVRHSGRASRGFRRYATASLYSSKIQVSLVPPPWLEFTTSEPSFSATRVSPPGTIVVLLLPVSTKGRRSTWRGARPEAVQVGQVESASVGWAIKPSGSRLSFSRKASIVA